MCRSSLLGGEMGSRGELKRHRHGFVSAGILRFYVLYCVSTVYLLDHSPLWKGPTWISSRRRLQSCQDSHVYPKVSLPGPLKKDPNSCLFKKKKGICIKDAPPPQSNQTQCACLCIVVWQIENPSVFVKLASSYFWTHFGEAGTEPGTATFFFDHNS